MKNQSPEQYACLSEIISEEELAEPLKWARAIETEFQSEPQKIRDFSAATDEIMAAILELEGEDQILGLKGALERLKSTMDGHDQLVRTFDEFFPEELLKPSPSPVNDLDDDEEAIPAAVAEERQQVPVFKWVLNLMEIVYDQSLFLNLDVSKL